MGKFQAIVFEKLTKKKLYKDKYKMQNYVGYYMYIEKFFSC